MVNGEIPGQYEDEETDEAFIKRIGETPVDRSIKRESRMTELPLDIDDDDRGVEPPPDVPRKKVPSLLDEESDVDDDTD